MQREPRTAHSLRQRLRAAGDALEIAPTHVVALLVVASCACAGLVILWWTSRPPSPAADPPDGLEAASATSTAAPSGPAPDELVVHVSGAVASPGVQTLPADARVDDAVSAAGGVTGSARTDQLNLARPLRDGEQIHVPDASEIAAAPAGAGGTTGPAGADLINLNHATAAELEELPGVGPVLSERIVSFREANGGFRSIDELQQVSGIGEKIFAGLEDLVTV